MGGKDELMYQLHNFGPIGEVPVTLFAFQVEGKLGALIARFSSDHFGTLFAILKERYGNPTNEDIREWKSRAGATFPNRIARWMGKTISIGLDERGSKIDQGVLSYETVYMREYTEAKKKQSVKKGASDL